MIPDWPQAVRDFLQNCYGTSKSVTPLYGLSHNAIWQICYANEAVILKKMAQTKELNFYQILATRLTAQGVPIPRLEWSLQLPDANWFVIEYIPKALPRERWLADQEVMSVLYRLHHSVLHDLADTDWLFRPEWTDAMSEAALTIFPTSVAKMLRPLFHDVQTLCQPLFEPRGWISGDPNPMNWGMRADDSLVLFDWERFGRGTPALDLAITLPGLPTVEQYQTAAMAYLQNENATSTQHSSEQLAREIALAKVWSVVEFFSAARAGQVGDTQVISEIIERIPLWLETINQWVH